MNFLSCLATLILAASPSLADDQETLQQALTKVAGLDSYSFKGETEVQSQFGAGVGGQAPSLDGKYQKEVGLYIKSDRGEVFRKGDRVLVKQGENDWQDLAQFQPPAPPAADGQKPRFRGNPMMIKLMLRNLKAPHEELRDLAKGLKAVKKAEKPEKIGDVECFEYSGELSDEALKGSPLGRLALLGGANASLSATARIWVDTQGNVAIYEVLTKGAVNFQGNQVEISVTRRSEITDAGKTKVEVPEGVQKLLSAKPKAEKSEDKPDEKKEDKKDQ
ncbi:MAG TPA: hypothetical protein VKU80_12135 [Planctomycetota bacterium]|nr:hypothetical protein [Planctomycetota bacterium]